MWWRHDFCGGGGMIFAVVECGGGLIFAVVECGGVWWSVVECGGGVRRSEEE